MKQPPWLLVAAGSLQEGCRLVLDPAEGRHATGPLRLRPGDRLVLADGQGSTAAAVLCGASRSRVEVEVGRVASEPRPPGDGVELALAILDGRTMDWAVQKAVEVGVRRLLPLLCERSQPRRADAERRLEHWRRIALQALKQCHRPWFMEVDDIVDPPALVARCPAARGLVADPGGELPTALAAGGGWLLAVGPEGGFSAAELRLFGAAGWRRLRLGSYVLRSETAAVVGAAMLGARMADG